MALVRFYNDPDFDIINRELNRAFKQFGSATGSQHNMRESTEWYPQIDVIENNDNFVLTAELPGINKEDLNIEFEKGVLRISGERKQPSIDENANYLRNERVYGKFSREFNVNVPIETGNIAAAYKNGILTLTLPKAAEAKPKSIKIK